MLNRYRAWRDRRWWNSLDSKIVVTRSGRTRVRVTMRRGEIIGVEIWRPVPNGDASYYEVIR